MYNSAMSPIPRIHCIHGILRISLPWTLLLGPKGGRIWVRLRECHGTWGGWVKPKKGKDEVVGFGDRRQFGFDGLVFVVFVFVFLIIDFLIIDFLFVFLFVFLVRRRRSSKAVSGLFEERASSDSR